MIRVLEAVLIIYLDTQQGNMRQWLMEYKVTGLIPILTFNYRSGTCVNVSSPSTLIRLEIPNGTRYLCWAFETVWGKEGDTNLTHKFTCLSLGCASSDLNAPHHAPCFIQWHDILIFPTHSSSYYSVKTSEELGLLYSNLIIRLLQVVTTAFISG